MSPDISQVDDAASGWTRPQRRLCDGRPWRECGAASGLTDV